MITLSYQEDQSLSPVTLFENSGGNAVLADWQARIARANPSAMSPFILGITGSVSVGKTTFSQGLQAALSHVFPQHPIAIIQGDGFLYPNAHLTAQGWMRCKGFPHTYDFAALQEGLQLIRSGKGQGCRFPLYSHYYYDILPQQYQTLSSDAHIVLVEGLHLLFCASCAALFDAVIYIDAPETAIEQWYYARFLQKWRESKYDSSAFFHRFSHLSLHAVTCLAEKTWATINRVNLHTYVLPFREQADYLVEKSANHQIIRTQERAC